jgi:mono/diheme cytochrome c family protein
MSSSGQGSPRHVVRRAASLVAGLLAVAALSAGAFGFAEASAYDASVDKVYAVAPGTLARSTDPAAIARGKHLAESLMPCAIADCHGPDLAGGHVTEGGPVARSVTPNITVTLLAYTDGEIERLLRHGVKKDGRTVRFMPVDTFNWLPDSDVVAIISYLRSMPPVDRASEGVNIRPFGKVLDRLGYVPIDIARRIDHDDVAIGPAPSPTPEYGRWIARACADCHGPHMSGGRIPGMPPDFPVPLNLTPHATGLGDWTYEDFVKLGETGRRRDGRALAAFMPVEALRNMDEAEKRALWAYLRSLPPVPFGQR